jgi:hypothetical protein
MTAPVFHLIIPGLPKSANVFIQRTMQLTLGCTFVRFVSSEPSRNILPDKFDEFFALRRAVGGEHFPPNEHNLRLLAARDVRKIAVLVRDPRDAVISWWRHLERSDIKARHRSEPSYFYDLSPEEKLRDLIVRRLPDYQTRVATWLDVADTSPTLECYINRFETFAADQRGALRTMLAFFGHISIPSFPISTMREMPASTRRRISDGVGSDPIATRRRLNWSDFSMSGSTAASPFAWDGLSA